MVFINILPSLCAGVGAEETTCSQTPMTRMNTVCVTMDILIRLVAVVNVDLDERVPVSDVSFLFFTVHDVDVERGTISLAEAETQKPINKREN